MDLTIFTIGHSTRAAGEFIELLHAHGVRRLVDVRQFPASRRYPHFARAALAASLPAAGIVYEHEVELGGRRRAAADSPNRAWRSASFRAYADHMATPAFAAALARLIDGATLPTAIMCAEAVPWHCHRQLIADALLVRGIEVRHITTKERAELHRLNPHARVGPDGTLTYPDEAGDQTSLL